MMTLRRPQIDRPPALGTVHAVGAAGLETASMVRYLVEGGFRNIVLHEASGDLETSFWAGHRHQPSQHAYRSWAALQACRELRFGADYLEGINSAALILVPVAWFLHHKNSRLGPLRERFIYYPDACFDLWRGTIIGVTGSYGKTTTTRFAATLSGGIFCGNDRESFCDLAALADQPEDRCMAFEASNRHLHNGWQRLLNVGVLTAISRNHEPDHGSFTAYRRVKYSMAVRCSEFLYHAAIPSTYPDSASLVSKGISYGEGGVWRWRNSMVVGPGQICFPVPGNRQLNALDRDNLVAAAVAVRSCGISIDEISRRSDSLIESQPRYRHVVSEIGGRIFINDAAAAMPAATAGLVGCMQQAFVLICGGDRQQYNPGEFDQLALAVATNRHAVQVLVVGAMSDNIAAALRSIGFCEVAKAASIPEAVERAIEVSGATVVFSPGCNPWPEFVDKYERGENFDLAVSNLLSSKECSD